MKTTFLLPAAFLLFAACPAHAAGVTVGLNLQASAFVIGDNYGTSGTTSVPVLLGAHLMVGGPSTPADGWRWRGTLEGKYWLSGVGAVTADATLLKQQPAFYFGGGLGSGVLVNFNNSLSDNLFYGALVLTNLHGVIGTDLGGGAQLEGVLRLGLISGVEARINFPLP